MTHAVDTYKPCPLTAAILARVSRTLEEIAWIDAPAIHALAMPRNNVAFGCSTGSGHSLAHAHGLSGVSVMLTLSPLVDALHKAAPRPEFFDTPGVIFDCAKMAATHLELLGAHELGHALASPLDSIGDITDDKLHQLRSLTAVGPRSLMPNAEAHDAPWAAATAILYGRLWALRPEQANEWHAAAVIEFRRYALDFDSVASLVAEVPAEASIRRLLAIPEFIERVEASIPSLEERRSIIANQQTRPAGVPPVRDPAATAA